MRLVFLSWCYPPMAYPRATQVARLAQHMRSRPLEVYCLAPSGGISLRVADEGGIDLVRIPRALPTRIIENFIATRRHRTLQEYDTRYFWWRLAARHIAALGLSADDVLVTFGQPMVDHLAGLSIKRKTGVRWIAHFSDPWADNPLSSPSQAAHEQEQSVLQSADLAVFTSQETVDLVYAKYDDALRMKARILPHAFDPTLYPVATPKGDCVIVRYIGNLFPGRGPEHFLRAVSMVVDRSPSALSGVRFEFVGAAVPFRAHPILDALPAGSVSFRSRVPYQESLALMTSSDLLLNIDAPADTSVFLPSKLIDYVGAGRPILSVSPPGASANLVSALGGWVADPRQPEEVAARLVAAVNFVCARPAQWGNADVRQRYEASSVADRFEQMIASLHGPRDR